MRFDYESVPIEIYFIKHIKSEQKDTKIHLYCFIVEHTVNDQHNYLLHKIKDEKNAIKQY
jgi:hypothetical protein